MRKCCGILLQKCVAERRGRVQHAGEDSRRENARPEMKKRKVSAFYTGLFGFTSIFFLVGIAFVMWFLVVYMQEDIASLRGLSLIGVILFLLQV